MSSLSPPSLLLLVALLLASWSCAFASSSSASASASAASEQNELNIDMQRVLRVPTFPQHHRDVLLDVDSHHDYTSSPHRIHLRVGVLHLDIEQYKHKHFNVMSQSQSASEAAAAASSSSATGSLSLEPTHHIMTSIGKSLGVHVPFSRVEQQQQQQHTHAHAHKFSSLTSSHIQQETAEHEQARENNEVNANNADDDQLLPFLLTFKSPLTSSSLAALDDITAPYRVSLSSYIPHNTYLAVLPYNKAVQVKHNAQGCVFVGLYDTSMKLESSVADALAQLGTSPAKSAKSAKVSSADAQLKLRIHLQWPLMQHEIEPQTSDEKTYHRTLKDRIMQFIDGMEKQWNQDVEHFEIIHHIEHQNTMRPMLTIRVVDASSFILSIPQQLNATVINDLFARLLQHPYVLHVSPEPHYAITNKHASYTVQSGSQQRGQVIWKQGITGVGQVVAVGDTGVDYDNCFFAEEDNAPPPLNMMPNNNKRKIISYQTSTISDDNTGPRAGPGDGEGHGTHTAGTVAGQIKHKGVSNETYLELQKYNGVAYGAKLVIVDFQNPGDSNLYVPNDIYNDYLIKTRQWGAYISSNSWGDDSGVYDSYTRDLDAFISDYPDYLFVIAAGNDGTKGMHSIATPAIAKNVLTVGSSMNAQGSFFDQGYASGVQIVSPSQLAGKYGVTPASFGPSFFEYDYHLKDDQSLGVCVAQPVTACGSVLVNAEACRGKIVLVQRGQCQFITKALAVQAAEGLTMIVINNEPGQEIMDDESHTSISIPSVMIDQTIGEDLMHYLNDDSSRTASLYLPVSVQNSAQNEHHLSYFSSKGPTLDGRIKPEVVAPGEYIQSMHSDHDLHSFQCGKSACIEAMMGTSMATPVTAAAATLVRQYFTDGYYYDLQDNEFLPFTPSAALLKAVLINSAQSLEGDVNVASVGNVNIANFPNFLQGHGRIMIGASLTFPNKTGTKALRPQDTANNLFVKDGISIANQEVHHYCVHVQTSSLPFAATLVWTDPPPTLPTSLFSVNNLDLSVMNHNVTSDGINGVWVGNQKQLNQEMDGTLRPVQWDVDNNNERVYIPTPVPGYYSVLVRGTHLPGASQKYSLVVNGNFTIASGDKCSTQVYCPNNCSSHGVCRQLTSETTTYMGFERPPIAARCDCIDSYAGADCSIPATLLIVGQEVTFQMKPDTWQYAYYRIGERDSHVRITMKRIGGSGDPDFYITTPKDPGYPTLEYFTYSNTECDPCGTTTHVQEVDHNYLVKDGVIMIGVWGYCCVDSTVSIKVQT